MLVFVIPVIASVALASVVMGQMLQGPERGSGGASEHVTIVGLKPVYAAPANIEVHVHVTHDRFDCGDLTVDIRQQPGQTSVHQEGFFGQCFASTNTMIPLGGAFSATVTEPGTYSLVATIQDAQKSRTASAVGAFTVN